MHNDIAIRAEDISKKFCRSLRHVMVYGVQDIARNTFGMSSRSEMLREGEFWAVNDISFEVKKGETLGIIGANGSGKSTLLKLLNGIFMPDKGRIEIKGRVGALIEVGAGFHPMLTGRENIYVNGAILGMSKKEIDRKFDDIVAFADIGDFIDSPVKHYSSGMYVRLGFAVAVHSDPDILLIDEVLAVGDASFQNKCFKKLSEFKREGKTIILVTHDMEAIVKHCDEAILLKQGTILKSGNPKDVVNWYYDIVFTKTSSVPVDTKALEENAESIPDKSCQSELEQFLKEVPVEDKCIYRGSYNEHEHRHGDKRAEIIDYLIVSDNKYDPAAIKSGDKIDIYLKVRYYQGISSSGFGFTIKTIDGIVIYASNNIFEGLYVRPVIDPHVIVFKTSLKLDFAEGDYFISQGIVEIIGEEHIPIDIRHDFIHIHVNQDLRFTGLVRQETVMEEVSRRKIERPVNEKV